MEFNIHLMLCTADWTVRIDKTTSDHRLKMFEIGRTFKIRLKFWVLDCNWRMANWKKMENLAVKRCDRLFFSDLDSSEVARKLMGFMKDVVISSVLSRRIIGRPNLR